MYKNDMRLWIIRYCITVFIFIWRELYNDDGSLGNAEYTNTMLVIIIFYSRRS